MRFKMLAENFILLRTIVNWTQIFYVLGLIDDWISMASLINAFSGEGMAFPNFTSTWSCNVASVDIEHLRFCFSSFLSLYTRSDRLENIIWTKKIVNFHTKMLKVFKIDLFITIWALINFRQVAHKNDKNCKMSIFMITILNQVDLRTVQRRPTIGVWESSVPNSDENCDFKAGFPQRYVPLHI